jgi:hypothetical protein
MMASHFAALLETVQEMLQQTRSPSHRVGVISDNMSAVSQPFSFPPRDPLPSVTMFSVKGVSSYACEGNTQAAPVNLPSEHNREMGDALKSVSIAVIAWPT